MSKVIRRGGIALIVTVVASLFAFVAPAQATHTIGTVSKTSFPQGTTNLDFTVNGTGFTPTATVTVTPSTDVTVAPTGVITPTQMTVRITVGDNAATGIRTLTITNTDAATPPDEVSTQITITAKPRVTTITPNTGEQGETAKTLTVTGSGFLANTTVSFSGTGITLTSSTLVDATQLTVHVDIASGATTGPRNVTVTNPDGGTSTTNNAFTVNAPSSTTSTTTTTTTTPTPPPTIDDVFPGEVAQGTVAVIALTGENFTNFTAVELGPGMFLMQTVLDSPELWFLIVLVDDAAPTGPRDVTVMSDPGHKDTCEACLDVVEQGYHLVATDGGLFSFGSAAFHGSLGGMQLNAPVVGMAEDPSSDGYWMVASDGGVFAFGGAGFFGSMGGKHLNAPMVAMAATPTGEGYWLVARDGGIFAFGDAVFEGSMGGEHLNQPIVGMTADPFGEGYWLVASDGGIFSFGVEFHGSMGGEPLNAPIVGMAVDPFGGGYWLVASDGGIFSFDVEFFGSAGGTPLNAPVVGMAASPDGGGYWLVASDGGVFNYGDAAFKGSMGGEKLNRPVVAVGGRPA
jgi:hypothetical protein